MSTIKLLALGVELAGLVAAGAALWQPSGIGASQECKDVKRGNSQVVQIMPSDLIW